MHEAHPATAAGAKTSILLKLEHVEKTFNNGTTAVVDLNLEINQGEFVSLLGPSGCGKSTVLRIIAGLTDITKGQFRLESPHHTITSDRKISFVFQEPSLMPWSTVFNNVWLPLRLSGMSKRTALHAVNSALDQVGLANFSNAYPRELSGGMKMRVSIARALVTQPTLLLMDEPFAALDEITRFKLNDDLLALWQQFNLTVIFVTHSVYESVYLSQRILLMSERPGQVKDCISISDAYPRGDSYRSSSAYHEYCQTTYRALTQLCKPE